MSVVLRKHRLTPREGQVVRLISLGCTLDEAAAILGLSRSTVNSHKTRAMGRLGTEKVALLTRMAIKLKVTDINDKLTAPERRRSGRKDDGWNE